MGYITGSSYLQSAVRQLLRLRRPPAAIFAANDDSALGTMEAAREFGLGIP